MRRLTDWGAESSACYYVCAAFRGRSTARDNSDRLDYLCFSLAETCGLNCGSSETRMIQNFSASSVLAAVHAICIRKASCHCEVKSLLRCCSVRFQATRGARRSVGVKICLSSALTIKLTGPGTFIGPASGRTSSGATATGSGTYDVTELVSWHFSNLQTGSLIDLIDDGSRANGVAVFRIRYSHGSQGVLGVGSTDAGHRTGRWRESSPRKAM